MKFTILQKNFVKALNQVSRVVTARTTLPVLSNILISAEKGKIVLSATDLEVAIVSKASGKIDAEGQLTVPARLLSDFITNNNDESIDFETKENILNLKSKRYKAKISGISADEFPTIPSLSKEWSCSIKKDPFIDAMKKVSIAPANDETRPVLAGIFFQFDHKALTVVATDSYRLSEKKLVLDEEVPENKFIVPSRTMNEVVRLLSGSEATEIVLSSTENQVAFKIGETQVISRLIEGAFPNYTQIIPATTSIKVSVNHRDLASALKMAALFAKDSANNIKIETDPEKKQVIIKTAESQVGNSVSSIDAEIEGEKIEISFNVRYIMDVLGVLTDDSISLEFNDRDSAGLIRTKKDEDFIYIAMPLKVE